MTSVTLAQASIIVDETLKKGRATSSMPLTVVVLDAGGHIVAVKREDNSGIIRFEVAFGKAYGALGMGFGSREYLERAKANPAFVNALMAVSDGRVVPVPGGVLIKNAAGTVIGAVGVSGDVSDRDEECIVAGIAAAGLVAQVGK